MSDARLESIENKVDQILGIVGKLIDQGIELKSDVKRLDAKTDEIARAVLNVEKAVSNVESELSSFKEETRENFAKVEKRFQNVEERIGNIEERVGNIEGQFQNVEERIGNIEKNIIGIREEMRFGNRKTERLLKEVFENKILSDELLDRIEKLEEKNVA